MSRRLDRLDLAVTAAIVVLLLAIGFVVVRGDQIGIDVQKFGPLDVTSSRAAIQVTFSDPIDPSSAEAHVAIVPPVPGQFATTSNTLTFHPITAFKPQQDYQVTVQAGLVATTGRTLKHDVAWQFHVRAPRITYVGADGNLYVADPAAPDKAHKLTDSQTGIGSYDVAADGSKIVYADVPNEGTNNLYVWDTASAKSAMLLRCETALCANPVWRPDGGAVAFDQIGSGGTVASRVPRVVILDTATNTTQPLFKDNQIISSVPRWSPDGQKLAVSSASEGGIIIHDFASGKDTTIKTRDGESAVFSPDSRYFFFRKLVAPAAGASATHLVLVDLSTDPYTQRSLVPDTDLSNDVEAVWRDAKTLLVTRRSAFAKDAKLGSQFYNVDVASGASALLFTDTEHRHRSVNLSPLEDTILFQRVAVGGAGGAGLYILSAGSLEQISSGGTNPRWLP